MEDHPKLFNALRAELRAICRNPLGGFKNNVSVGTLLDLECRYAEAETAIMDAQHKRVMESFELADDIEEARR
jgi:hypothetical protein